MPKRTGPRFLGLIACSLALTAPAASAFAADTGPLVARLDRLVDVSETRLVALVSAADASIERLAARDADAAALTVASRARGQIEAMSGRTRLTVQRVRDALIRKFASGEDAGQVRAVLSLTVVRLEAEVEAHRVQCLADIESALVEAGLGSP
jgi:hypothetical protein